MVKILILNTGKKNKGSLALVYSAIETIKRFMPDATFTFVGHCDEDVIDESEPKMRQLAGMIYLRRPQRTLLSLFYILKCIYITFHNKHAKPIKLPKSSRLFEYYDCDIVLNLGGDSLMGVYGWHNLPALLNIWYGVLLDKKVILYSESLGYFPDKSINFIAKTIINKVDLIILRENHSKKWLEDNEVTHPRIYVSSDSAFVLRSAPQPRVLEILSKEKITLSKPLIGVNPSGLIDRFSLKNKNSSKIFAKVIDGLIENLGVSVILIPHVYNVDVDDRLLIKDIFQEIENKNKTSVIKGEYTPRELKGIIGQCDLFVGARMHAVIASTSMLIPTVGIAYGHKMHGVIGEGLGQKEHILDIKSLTCNALLSKITTAWKHKKSIHEDLKVRIPKIKEKVIHNGQLVKETFDDSFCR